ncbi:beta-propeller fold lactonase family protein [Paenibacillus sp.]|uniref:beta-propeller fold lactonase family protein n=1 Tax=Paenibacillus sp. TaxID=58172 RepID=UPI0037C56FCA
MLLNLVSNLVVQTVSTLQNNATADIRISSDGCFLYGSNHGHDSIVIYSVDSANGILEIVGYESTRGGHLCNFSLSQDNRFIPCC